VARSVAQQAHFRPEFINRLDEIVVFQPFDRSQIPGIARLQTPYLAKRLQERRIDLEISDGVLVLLATSASIRWTTRIRRSARSRRNSRIRSRRNPRRHAKGSINADRYLASAGCRAGASFAHPTSSPA